MNKLIKEAVTETDVKFWIQIGTIIAGLAVGWGILSSNVSENKRQCEALAKELEVHITDYKTWHDSNTDTLLKIQVQLAEIQKDIAYIKVQLK